MLLFLFLGLFLFRYAHRTYWILPAQSILYFRKIGNLGSGGSWTRRYHRSRRVHDPPPPPSESWTRFELIEGEFWLRQVRDPPPPPSESWTRFELIGGEFWLRQVRDPPPPPL